MQMEEHICSSCGHLSATEWDRCHICSEELPVGNTQQINSLTSYYNALDAGYGRFAVIGYISTFALPLFSGILMVAAVAIYASIFGSSVSTEPLRAAYLLLGSILAFVQIAGAVLLAGSYKAINGDVLDQTEAPALGTACKSGAIELVAAAILVGILLIIPLIGSIVALLLGIAVLASPLFIYRRWRQWKATRKKVILPLVDLCLETESTLRVVPEEEFTDSQRTTAGILVLKLLAAAPASRITDSERDALVDLLRSNTETAHTLVESSSFSDAVKTVCREASQPRREKVKEQLLEIGEELKSAERFKAAEVCSNVANQLVDQFGLSDQADRKTTESDTSTDSASGDDPTGAEDGDSTGQDSLPGFQSQESDMNLTSDDPSTAPQPHPEPSDTVSDSSDVETDDEYSTSDYPDRFESWEGAIEMACVKTRRLLLADIRRVRDDIGRVPTKSEYREYGVIPLPKFIRHFDSWEAAVSSVDSEESASDSNTAKQRELITELQRLDDGTNLFPYGNKVGTRGDYRFSEYTDEFSSWEAALDAAGIDVEARLLDELRRVRDEIGGLPTQTEMSEHGRVSSATFARYLGSWSEAKSRIDPPSVETNPDPEPKTVGSSTTGDDSSIRPDPSLDSGGQNQDAAGEESPGIKNDGPESSDPSTNTQDDSQDNTPDQDGGAEDDETGKDEDQPQTGDDDLDALFDELDDMT